MGYAEILDNNLQNVFSCCRLKIKHNIGIVFVKMGQFSDACSKFEDIMQEKPDYASGNIAFLCLFFMDRGIPFDSFNSF
jgi:intraflagellar transport protein 88